MARQCVRVPRRPRSWGHANALPAVPAHYVFFEFCFFIFRWYLLHARFFGQGCTFHKVDNKKQEVLFLRSVFRILSEQETAKGAGRGQREVREGVLGGNKGAVPLLPAWNWTPSRDIVSLGKDTLILSTMKHRIFKTKKFNKLLIPHQFSISVTQENMHIKIRFLPPESYSAGYRVTVKQRWVGGDSATAVCSNATKVKRKENPFRSLNDWES